MHYICQTHYLVDSSWKKEKDVLEQEEQVLIGQVSPCHSRLSLKNIPDKETNITYLDFIDWSIQEWCADYVCQFMKNSDAKKN